MVEWNSGMTFSPIMNRLRGWGGMGGGGEGEGAKHVAHGGHQM